MPVAEGSRAKIGKISVVIAVRNEEQALPELYNRLKAVLDGVGLDWELILVEDSSTDRTVPVIRELGARDVSLRLDSELVVRQVEGSYKVKHPELQRLHTRVYELMDAFDTVEIEHVPREENKDTDKLVNAALDGKELD